jgi:hypothetical protein
MASALPPCQTINVLAFRGDRSRVFAGALQSALDDGKHGRSPGPSLLDCLLYSGHAGVSTDLAKTIYGFNPNGALLLVWQLMDRLKSGDSLPGMVRDDTSVFAAAQGRRLLIQSFAIVLPDPQFQHFQASLDAERKKSQYSYSFPNGEGDCNCTTWLERMGLPLLTGRMSEFAGLPGIPTYATRRFGQCV